MGIDVLVDHDVVGGTDKKNLVVWNVGELFEIVDQIVAAEKLLMFGMNVTVDREHFVNMFDEYDDRLDDTLNWIFL